ncbi:MAG: RNHCP domain-containing protein [Chloroflexota bacterium]
MDYRTPGDRRSDCRSLMAPIGTDSRPNGEQLVIHQCLGCGIVRHNRVAADDDPLLLMRLPLQGIQEEDRRVEEPASDIA